MISASPFLHREDKQQRPRLAERQQTYAERIVPPPEVQRGRMEMYRYNWYVRNDTLARFMQRLGNWGRKYFPWIGAGGWNGIGGGRLGGDR